ncbi:MAG TPA: M15 family metallopeptidase [Bacilli bacterium]
MKKKYIFFLSLLTLAIFLLVVSLENDRQRKKRIEELARYLNEEEVAFAIANNIYYEDISEFLEYENFNIYYYRSYLRLKEDYQLSALGAINFFHNPDYFAFYKNPKPALFLETPLVLVNKCYYLEKDYVPKDLVIIDNYDLPHFDRAGDEIRLKREAMESLKLMLEEAKSENLKLVVYSGYRSYQKQEYLYYEVYNQNDSLSARPGFSEHQTGYAVDLSTASAGLSTHFEKTPEFKWLSENAHRFGFILRFPKDKKWATGYDYEPWHFRYVGVHATEIRRQGLTLEEYILANFEL